uniref:Uncharacterized protein n=1 Tax=Arundo donax TaxID=35708 RepID=A0A0A9GY63_ARUDO
MVLDLCRQSRCSISAACRGTYCRWSRRHLPSGPLPRQGRRTSGLPRRCRGP